MNAVIVRAAVLLSMAALAPPIGMAQPEEQAVSAPDYSGVKYRQGTKFRCPEGEYRGPASGKRVYRRDEYAWFVTRDFARRFCMPESMIDDTLKGAEAVAFRIKPSATANCFIDAGKEVCRRKSEFQLELYLRSDLKLPRSHPEVKFFIDSVESSGDLIDSNQDLRNADRRRAGVYQDPLGSRPPYHAYAGPDELQRVKIIYVNFDNSKLAQPLVEFSESFYQASWVDGVDLLRLQAGVNMGFGFLAHPTAKYFSSRFGVGFIRVSDLPQEREKRLGMTRSHYAHIVELPEKISEQLRNHDKIQGDVFNNAIRRSLGLPAAASAPDDVEPVVAPVIR